MAAWFDPNRRSGAFAPLNPQSRNNPSQKRIRVMKQVIVITGASSGFGRLSANALATAGHTVYASMRDIAGRNAKNAAEMAETSKRDGVDLRAIELDVQSEPSIDVAVDRTLNPLGRFFRHNHMHGDPTWRR